MKPRDRFDTLLKKFRDDPQFIAEGLLLDINEQLVKLLQENGVSKSALAQKLGVSNAYVSKLLNGNENLTIKQLVKIATVLDCSIDVALVRRSFTVNRLYSYKPGKVDVTGFNQQFNVRQPDESNFPVAA